MKKEFDIAVVGGSDLIKIQEQLGGGNLFDKYKYVFAENGLVAFKDGKALPSQVNNECNYIYIIACQENGRDVNIPPSVPMYILLISMLSRQSIQDMLGEDSLQDFINFVLRYISELQLPFKRGTFVEFRTGMINVSPVGRNCSKKEREQFYEYDSEHHIREKFIQALKREFPDLALTYSIGERFGDVEFTTIRAVQYTKRLLVLILI